MMPKRHVSKRDGIACSQHDSPNKLNNQHNWENLYDHATSYMNLEFDNELDIHMNFQNYEESDYNIDMDYASRLLLITCSRS